MRNCFGTIRELLLVGCIFLGLQYSCQAFGQNLLDGGNRPRNLAKPFSVQGVSYKAFVRTANWDETNRAWLADSSLAISTYINGNITREVTYQYQQADSTDLIVHKPDDQGRDTATVSYAFVNRIWKRIGSTRTVFNAEGGILLRESIAYAPDSTVPTTGSRVMQFFDSGNRIIRVESTLYISGWKPSYTRYTYFSQPGTVENYDSTVIWRSDANYVLKRSTRNIGYRWIQHPRYGTLDTARIEQTFISDTWQNKYRYSTRYPSDSTNTKIIYSYQGNQWEPIFCSCDLGSATRGLYVTQEWNSVATRWDSTNKIIYNYDNQRNLLSETFTLYSRGVAQSVSGSYNVYEVYPSGQVKRILTYQKDIGSPRYVLSIRTDYLTQPPTAIKQLLAQSLLVYPNPTHDHITLQTQDQRDLSGSILDAQGRIVQMFQGHEVRVEQLPLGLYLVRGQAGGQTYVARFWKQ